MAEHFLLRDNVNTVKRCILATVAEALRFTIRQNELDSFATEDDLFARLKENAPDKPPEEIKKIVRELFSFFDGADDPTYRELLDYSCPSFPELSPEQRITLRTVARQHEIIGKELVCDAIGVKQDDQAIQFLFGSGAEMLPAEIFQDLVEGLDYHPQTPSFFHVFCEQMVTSGRRMISLFPYCVLFFLICALLPFIADSNHSMLAKTVVHFLEADWTTGCQHGATSTKGCNFIQRNLNEIETVEFDALRFFRTELINKLWNADGTSAAFTPIGYSNFSNVGSIGSTYPIGALLLRLAPKENVLDAPMSCKDLNISIALRESRIPATFDCSAAWSVAVPFSATKSEALALAANATVVMPIFAASALVAQFAFFQPATGLYGYARIYLGLPEAGHVFTRFDVMPIDYKAHEMILPLVITSAVVFCVSAGFIVAFILKRQAFLFIDGLIDAVLLGVITYSYVCLATLPKLDLCNIDYIPFEADVAADQFQLGVRVLAFWALFTLAISIRYLQEISSLYIVIAVLRAAIFELIAMILLFGIWTTGFAVVARLFFGSISLAHASSFTSFSLIFDFFSEEGSYDILAGDHYILGPVFWFAFSLFVTFFALNLLIAVLTAPLDQVKESCNLHLEMQAAVTADVENDPDLSPCQRFFEKLRIWILSYVNFVADAIPHFWHKAYWLQLSDDSDVLRQVHEHADPIQACTAGKNILKALNNENSGIPYNTRLCQQVLEHQCMDRVSTVLTLGAIAAVSTNALIRDARLEKALMRFDMFTSNAEKLEARRQSAVEQARKFSTSSTIKAKAPMTKVHVMGKFAFTQYLMLNLHMHRLSLLRFVLMFGVIVSYYFLGLSTDTRSAYLAESIYQGVTQFPIHQECYDANCTGAFSFRKTWMDTGDLADFYVWVDKVLKRQLFFRGILGASSNNHTVLWDERITFDLPIYMRQLRSVLTDCNFEETDFSSKRCQILKETVHCGKRGEFTKIDMPNTGNLPETVYQYQKRCVERRQLGFPGHAVRVFPCEGYIAEINSREDLDEVMLSSWFDTQTRFIAVTVTYRISDVAIEHSLYLELDEGGGAAFPRELAVSLTPDESKFQAMLILAGCAFASDLLLGALQFFFVGRSVGWTAPGLFAMIPIRSIVALVFVFLVPHIVYSQPSAHERIKLQLGIAALVLTFMATKDALFPMAGLISKQATKLFDTMANSARQCALLIPFYVIFLLALAYSGLLLFVNRSPSFSSLTWALITVSRGAFGDFSPENIQDQEVSEIYNMIFYAVILILLANLVLAMITSAAGDTLATPLAVELAERVCSACGWHVLYGNLAYFAIAMNVWWIEREMANSVDIARVMPTIATLQGKRLPFLSECLCVALGPHRANDVMEHLHLDSIVPTLWPSTIVWILETHSEFVREHRVGDTFDWQQENRLLQHSETLVDQNEASEVSEHLNNPSTPIRVF